jgi:hypothetical protein
MEEGCKGERGNKPDIPKIRLRYRRYKTKTNKTEIGRREGEWGRRERGREGDNKGVYSYTVNITGYCPSIKGELLCFYIVRVASCRKNIYQ